MCIRDRGKQVKVGKSIYTVVGVEKGDAQRNNSSCYIPLTTGQLIYKGNDPIVNNAILTLRGIDTDEQMEDFENRLIRRLSVEHHFAPDDRSAIWIRNTMEQYKSMMVVFGGINLFVWIIGLGTLLALFSPLIPHIYNTEPAIRELASSVIRTAALCMPLFAFANAAYFTLRSGGKTLITFFFDSCYTWLINFLIAFVLSRYTALPLPIVYLFVNGVDLLKCIIGFILVKKGVWVNNIVASSQDVPQAD